MLRLNSPLVAAACFLACTAVAGCKSCQTCRQCGPNCTTSNCGPMGAEGMMVIAPDGSQHYAPGPNQGSVQSPMPAGQVFVKNGKMLVPARQAQNPKAGEVVIMEGPMLQSAQPRIVQGPPTAGPVMAQQMPQPMPQGPAFVQTVKEDKPAFPRGVPTVQRKGFVDVTAHSSFGHAPDYRWISGEVQKWRDEWRLRYATVDEVDPYGGSVILAGDQHLQQLREGEHLKLQGQLVPGNAGGAVFHIEAAQPASSSR